MINDAFIEKIFVIDEWISGEYRYRLVDKGVGPKVLQVSNENSWIDEKNYYSWSVLTNRILLLKQKINTKTIDKRDKWTIL